MKEARRGATGRMAAVDSYRGIAALLVLLFHASGSVASDKYFGSDPLHGLFHFGGHGVDLFFVLSGFIIMYVHWHDLGGADRMRPYFVKRFIRLFPILWIVAIPFMLSSALIKSESMPVAWGQRVEVAVGSLFLLPTRLIPVPVVLWSLRHELFFYAMFGLAIWRPRLGFSVIFLWVSLCVYHVARGFGSNFVTDFLFSPYNFEFLMGIGCGYLMRTMRIKYPLLLCLLGVILFLAASASYDLRYEAKPWLRNQSSVWPVLQFGVSSVLIILGLAEIDLRRTVVPPGFLIFLGAASYSIYLVHFPIISFTCKVLKSLGSYVPITPLVAFLVVVPAALAAGLLLHVYVEAPVVSVCRNALLACETHPGPGAPLPDLQERR